MMDLLKISGFPPGAVASSPNTYDEALANPYPNLPDPLTFKSGQKVTTAAMWRKRRAEILEDFERDVYGRRPQRIPAVSWLVVKTTTEANGNVATVAKQLLGRVDNSGYPAISVNVGNGPGPTKPDGTVEINDAWVDAKGSFLAAVGAAPVYALLGKRGLGRTEMPAIDTPVIDGDLGFRQHTAGHTPNPTWPTFLSFADR